MNVNYEKVYKNYIPSKSYVKQRRFIEKTEVPTPFFIILVKQVLGIQNKTL